MKKIYRAVQSNQINQRFGSENTPKELLPIYKSLGLLGHDGYDFGVKCKDFSVKTGGQCEPVYCDIDCKATVTVIQKSVEFGFGIVALSEDQDGTFEHLWWHLDSIAPSLRVGSKIESGDFLGISGATGRTTGAHLHRQMRPMGKDIYGNYYRLYPNNGYGGAINLEPYFENVFIKDKMDNLYQQLSIWQKIIALLNKKVL